MNPSSDAASSSSSSSWFLDESYSSSAFPSFSFQTLPSVSNIPDSYWIQCDICDEKKFKNGYFIGHLCKICASCQIRMETEKLSYQELMKLMKKLPSKPFTSHDGGPFTQPQHAAECGAYKYF
jgi:hypothetical protein